MALMEDRDEVIGFSGQRVKVQGHQRTGCGQSSILWQFHHCGTLVDDSLNWLGCVAGGSVSLDGMRSTHQIKYGQERWSQSFFVR